MQNLFNYLFVDVLENRENVKYEYIHHKYILRGLPIKILTTYNSSQSASVQVSIKNDISNILQKTRPCNLETNLIARNTNPEDISNALHFLQEDDEINSYFVQFRNCQFEGLKASRAFMKKPYFYPQHLDPPYSSWVIMSANYESRKFKDLILDGLIIVSQMSGSVHIELRGKAECLDACGEFDVLLSAGDSLVYLSEIWSFSYKSVNNDESITFITETYFYN